LEFINIEANGSGPSQNIYCFREDRSDRILSLDIMLTVTTILDGKADLMPLIFLLVVV
jgi:hypothetical protein